MITLYNMNHSIKSAIGFAIAMPAQALAASSPSMTFLWMELILLVAMLFALKSAHFSNQQKLIAFVTYVLLGIFTKTLWIPVVIFIGLYYYFNTTIDDDSY